MERILREFLLEECNEEDSLRGSSEENMIVSPNNRTLSYPSNLSAKERLVVHQTCERLGVKTRKKSIEIVVKIEIVSDFNFRSFCEI